MDQYPRIGGTMSDNFSLNRRRAASRLGTLVRGKYRVDRVLGVGGMATVYAATHRHGYRVALKILHDQLSGGDEAFLREARLANRIDHPGVLGVQDDDVTDDGCLFLVMPLLEGETLRARWERREQRLDWVEVVAIGRTLLNVLAAAHAKKIVHRDIKPENLFLTTTGQLKVLDFGIARALEEGASAATRSGRAVGTPAFMAPEQALGRTRDLDPRTDIWGAGATMFSLVSGRYVHEAETGAEIVIRTATRPAPALVTICPHVPVAVCEVIDKALAFEKEARWANAAAMELALAGALAASGAPTSVRLPFAPLTEPDDLGDSGEDSVKSDVAGRALAPRNGGRGQNENVQRADGRSLSTRTRTTTALASITESPRTPRSALGRIARAAAHFRAAIARRSTWVVAAAFLLGAAGAFARYRFHTTDVQEIVPATARTNPESLEWPSRETTPAAFAKFTSGIQLWKDAAADEAREAFEQAVIADASLASAHLRYVMCSGNITPAVRDHYGKATQLRALLSEDEQQILRAFEPAMRDPADLAGTEHALSALAIAKPDPLILATVAARRLRLGNPKGAIEAADQASSAADATLAIALAIRAMSHNQLDDLNAARADLQSCILASPHSSICFEVLSTLESSEGRCSAVANVSRQWIAASPQNSLPYAFLAGGLLMTEGAVEAAEDVLERRWARVDASLRGRTEAEERLALELWRGDFDAAERSIDAWENSTASLSDSLERGLPAVARLELSVERGRRAEAVRLARVYLDKFKAWSASSRLDPRVSAARVLHAFGAVSDDSFRAQLDEWRLAAGDGYGPPARIWFNLFAIPSVTREDAVLAVRELPNYAIFDRVSRGASCDLVMGRVHRLAGQPEVAERYLRRAEGACHLSDAMERIQSSLELGRAYERTGQFTEACAAYQRVLARWGHVKDSVTAREARKRAGALNCGSRTSGK